MVYFSKLYHFVAHSSLESGNTLSLLTKELHAKLALWINRLDNCPGRQVGINFWDTLLTYEKSWLARFRNIQTICEQQGRDLLDYMTQTLVHYLRGTVVLSPCRPFISDYPKLDILAVNGYENKLSKVAAFTAG